MGKAAKKTGKAKAQKGAWGGKRAGAGRPQEGAGREARRAARRAKASKAGAKVRAKHGIRAKTGRIRKYPGMTTTAGGWDKKTVPRAHDDLVADITAARVAAGGSDADRGTREKTKAKMKKKSAAAKK